MNMNIQAANSPVFFMAVGNAMGQQQQFAGANLQQVAQQLQQAMMGSGNSFQMGGPNAFNQAMGGNVMRPGFLTPPMGMGGMPAGLGQAPAMLNQFGNQMGQMGGMMRQPQNPLSGMMNMMMSMFQVLANVMGSMMQMRPGVQNPGMNQAMGQNPMMNMGGQMGGVQGQAGAQGQMAGGGFAFGGFVPFGGQGQMAGAGAGAVKPKPKPQISAQDQKMIDHMKATSGKKWLVNHGQYKKCKDGSYEFTKGEWKGYKAEPNGKGKFNITNPKGQAVGEWNAPKGADKVASPVAFDLNGDGKIGTTGQTTAKDRLAGTELGRTVQFDIDGDGNKDTIEWMAGGGDGLLVDNSDGRAATDMSGKRLYGDEGGKFANGYDKLKLRDANNDGKLTGEELKGLEMWVDNGDAQVQAGEMKSLQELGINEISVNKTDVKNERGETLMRADAKTVDGRSIMTEDVWFGQEGEAAPAPKPDFQALQHNLQPQTFRFNPAVQNPFLAFDPTKK